MSEIKEKVRLPALAWWLLGAILALLVLTWINSFIAISNSSQAIKEAETASSYASEARTDAENTLLKAEDIRTTVDNIYYEVTE